MGIEREYEELFCSYAGAIDALPGSPCLDVS